MIDNYISWENGIKVYFFLYKKNRLASISLAPLYQMIAGKSGDDVYHVEVGDFSSSDFPMEFLTINYQEHPIIYDGQGITNVSTPTRE
jgi:hypothetical protein